MDYAEIVPGVQVYVRLSSVHEFTSRKVEYTGEVIGRRGNMITLAPHDTDLPDLTLDLDTTPEFHVLPDEPENVWLTRMDDKITVHTEHGSLVLSPEQFETLKRLV
jgi:hypothetical protein